jgi:hypothetical protein
MTDEPQVTEEQQSQEEESGDEVAALQAERDELFDRLQRLAAEFDNFRKRNVRERAALSERANERLVKELIPILDDLGRALEAAADHEEAAKRPVRDSGPVEGVRGNREVPPTEESAQVETTPAPVADAPDTTTPKQQTEDPTKLEDSGDKS